MNTNQRLNISVLVRQAIDPYHCGDTLTASEVAVGYDCARTTIGLSVALPPLLLLLPSRPSSPLRLSGAGAWRRHVGEWISVWGVFVPGLLVHGHDVDHVSLEDSVSAMRPVELGVEEGDAAS